MNGVAVSCDGKEGEETLCRARCLLEDRGRSESGRQRHRRHMGPGAGRAERKGQAKWADARRRVCSAFFFFARALRRLSRGRQPARQLSGRGGGGAHEVGSGRCLHTPYSANQAQGELTTTSARRMAWLLLLPPHLASLFRPRFLVAAHTDKYGPLSFSFQMNKNCIQVEKTMYGRI